MTNTLERKKTSNAASGDTELTTKSCQSQGDSKHVISPFISPSSLQETSLGCTRSYLPFLLLVTTNRQIPQIGCSLEETHPSSYQLTQTSKDITCALLLKKKEKKLKNNMSRISEIVFTALKSFHLLSTKCLYKCKCQ